MQGAAIRIFQALRNEIPVGELRKAAARINELSVKKIL